MGYHENARRLCDFRGLGFRDSIDSSDPSLPNPSPKKKAKESLGFFWGGVWGMGVTGSPKPLNHQGLWLTCEAVGDTSVPEQENRNRSAHSYGSVSKAGAPIRARSFWQGSQSA